MLRCWKKKRNPPLDRDPACEGLLIKYYIRYKHNKRYQYNKNNYMPCFIESKADMVYNKKNTFPFRFEF